MNLKFKTMIPFLCICIGSLGAIIAAYFDYRTKIKEKQEQLDNEIKRNNEYKDIIGKNNSLLEKSNNIIKSQKTVIDTTTKIIDLQKQLNDKNIKIADLENQAISNITGGDSYPKLQFEVFGGQSIALKVTNENKYPIRNLIINLERRVWDYFVPQMHGTEHMINPDGLKDFTFQLGDIPIKFFKEIYIEHYNDTYDKFSYTYHVRWQNGFYDGGFSVIDGKVNDFKVLEDKITMYSKDIKFDKVVMINGRYSKLSPQLKTFDINR